MMNQKRKETAWKKSRKFGDIKGGRTGLRMADGIFKRYHSLLPPAKGQSLPIFYCDNPSRDFFHPLNVDEIKVALAQLPSAHTAEITHVWLRKVKKRDFGKKDGYQASFICGSGVNLIILNSFPNDLRMKFGKKTPGKKVRKFFALWENEWVLEEGYWFLEWTEKGISNYYLDHLLLHEIGHLLDSQFQRFYSKSSGAKKENFANGYAASWSKRLKTEMEF